MSQGVRQHWGNEKPFSTHMMVKLQVRMVKLQVSYVYQDVQYWSRCQISWQISQ